MLRPKISGLQCWDPRQIANPAGRGEWCAFADGQKQHGSQSIDGPGGNQRDGVRRGAVTASSDLRWWILGIMFGFCLPLLNPDSALCQLQSSPGGVVLIARVESLSLSSSSATTPPAGATGTEAAAAGAMLISTQWAVPANYTTLRLLCKSTGVGAALDGRAPQGEVSSGSAVQGPVRAGTVPGIGAPGEPGRLAPQSSEMTLWSQSSGATNMPGNRNDNVTLDTARNGASGYGTKAEKKGLSLRVEAL